VVASWVVNCGVNCGRSEFPISFRLWCLLESFGSFWVYHGESRELSASFTQNNGDVFSGNLVGVSAKNLCVFVGHSPSSCVIPPIKSRHSCKLYSNTIFHDYAALHHVIVWGGGVEGANHLPWPLVTIGNL